MFTPARAGYHARIYFKGQLWLEYTQPDIPCEDIKACYIIKGGTCKNMFTALHFIFHCAVVDIDLSASLFQKHCRKHVHFF